MIKKIVVLTVFVVSLQSCYYDVASELYPGNCSPPEVVSFADDIMPIIENKCSASCHTPGESGENDGIFIPNNGLSAYEGVMEKVNDGTFKSSVIDDGSMPKNETLTNCEYGLMKLWLEQGSENN